MKIKLSSGGAEEEGHSAGKREDEDMQGRDMKIRISRGGAEREHTMEGQEEKDTQMRRKHRGGARR